MGVLSFLWSWFPTLLLGIGYLIPHLRVPVFSKPSFEGLVAIIILIVAAAVWVVVEAVKAGHRKTTTLRLQIDCFRSNLIGVILVAWGAWLLADNAMQWWFPIPLAAAVVDMFLTPYNAIDNASQKPFLPQRGDI